MAMTGKNPTPSSSPQTDRDRDRFFINGQWVKPSGSESYGLMEAGTGEALGTAALGSEADIDAAVRSARSALDQLLS